MYDTSYPERRHVDGLFQDRRNSSALAMELRRSCTNPSVCNSIQATSSSQAPGYKGVSHESWITQL